MNKSMLKFIDEDEKTTRTIVPNGSYNISQMLKFIDDDEKDFLPTNNVSREQWFLTEDGLYEVLMQSRKLIQVTNHKNKYCKECKHKKELEKRRKWWNNNN